MEHMTNKFLNRKYINSIVAGLSIISLGQLFCIMHALIAGSYFIYITCTIVIAHVICISHYTAVKKINRWGYFFSPLLDQAAVIFFIIVLPVGIITYLLTLHGQHYVPLNNLYTEIIEGMKIHGGAPEEMIFSGVSDLHQKLISGSSAKPAIALFVTFLTYSTALSCLLSFSLMPDLALDWYKNIRNLHQHSGHSSRGVSKFFSLTLINLLLFSLLLGVFYKGVSPAIRYFEKFPYSQFALQKLILCYSFLPVIFPIFFPALLGAVVFLIKRQKSS